MCKMSTQEKLTELRDNYNKRLAWDLRYIMLLEKKELTNIDNFCRYLDSQPNKIPNSSSSEVMPLTSEPDVPSTCTDIQICYDSRAVQVKKVVVPQLDKLFQENNRNQEMSNKFINVNKVLREMPQQHENRSCISLNSSNLIEANSLEKKIQILQNAGNAILIKLSYSLVDVLQQPEGIICEQYDVAEKSIDVFTLKNEVVAVKLNNVFRLNCTLCVKHYADSFTTVKTKVFVDIIEIINVPGASEALQSLQVRTDDFTKENLNRLPTRTTCGSAVVYDVDENSANPVLQISNLSMPLKYSSINCDSSDESHFTKSGLENVKTPVVSSAQDAEDDCIIEEVIDNKLNEISHEIIDLDSDNSVEYFIKQEPRLLNSIVKLEDLGLDQWRKTSVKSFPEKKCKRYAITLHENFTSKSPASARFLRFVKRRAIQNLNRPTKDESKRKYNTRSSNRENRVRFKVENDIV